MGSSTRTAKSSVEYEAVIYNEQITVVKIFLTTTLNTKEVTYIKHIIKRTKKKFLMKLQITCFTSVLLRLASNLTVFFDAAKFSDKNLM